MKKEIIQILLISFMVLLFHQGFAQVLINEFMAANSSAINDPDNNESADWIELFNSSSASINISGYYLTDNLGNADKWAIPTGTIIPGNGYLVIWADGTDTLMHASFKLSSAGEELGFFDPNLSAIDSFVYSTQQTDISYGRQTDGSTNWGWFSTSTPGASNNTSVAYSGITFYETEFSVRGGFYSTTQSLELSSLGGTIHYTIDGSTPTHSDPIYSNPIYISNSTFVRARIYQTNFIPGPVITQSYFIGENFESRGLPVVSLVTDPEYFWSSDSGIYVQNFKPEWEYPVNIEFFENDGNNRSVFNERAGVSIKGQNSWELPQKMLGIEFRNEYGKGKLDYPLFFDRDRIVFDDIILRASGSDWAYTLFRDGLSQSLTQQNAPVPHQGFRQCIVTINGEYMGIHNLRSGINGGYIEENYNLEPGSFDLIENDGDIEEGSDAQFIELDALLNTDLSIQANYTQLENILDIENYTDYWISEIWTANSSWGHNVALWKPHDGGKWQFLFADFDRAFDDDEFELSEFAETTGGSSTYNYARQWMENLLENDDYAAYFAQRFNDHIYTTFHPIRVNAMIDKFANPLIPEIPFHVARWSGTTSGYGDGIETVAFWEEEVEDLRSFAEARHAFMMEELQSEFGFNSIVNLSTACYPENAGEIQINDFMIPQLPWIGPYFDQVPLQLTASSKPGYNFEGWSAIALTELVSLEEVWKYNDSGLDLGTTWKESNFDDSFWSSGQAELGYGDNDETTTISYGSSSQDKHITSYFRKQFLYTSAQQPLGAILKIRRDDGAVVYLNGVEIARSNMPLGSVTFETEASGTVSGTAEDNLIEYAIPLVSLNDTNIIAVEIHQANSSSSDLSFDLSFLVQEAAPTIISTNQTIDLTLMQDTGLMARYQPTGDCILSSEITTNTTLDIACSPYMAQGEVTIFPNISLSIDSGVEVWFPEDASLIVLGDLQVNGTQLHPVVFKANAAYDAVSWNIVKFDYSTGVNNLSFLEIKEASNGLHPVHHSAAISIRNSVVNMNDLILENNFSDPIYAINSDVTLLNSYIHSDVTGDLINVKYGAGTVSDCVFVGNDQPDTDAIDYDEVQNGIIRNSFFEGFLGTNSDGIDLGEQSSNVLIENCFLNNITDKGISIGQQSTAVIQNNTIVNCNMGVGIKDKGEASIDHVTFYSNATAVSVYEKNPGFGGGIVSISNSILSNSSTSPVFVDSLSTAILEGNIYDSDTLLGVSNYWMNPEFVNPTEYDFQLKPTSGAVLAALDGENLGTLDHRFISDPQVLISDIQYFHSINPDKEFIMILNPGQNTIDISGYSISNAIDYIFPNGTLIAPLEKILLAKDLSLFSSISGTSYEWTSGKLANEGEMIVLADSNGIIVDHVFYKPTAPWPVVQQGDECISLISPDLDNHFGSSWELGNVLSFTNVAVERNLKIYPNPASNHLYFNSEETISSIQVYDLTGRLQIDVQPVSKSGMLDVSFLNPGIYLATVNGVQTVKFVKR